MASQLPLIVQESLHRLHILQIVHDKMTEEGHYRLPKHLLCLCSQVLLPAIKALQCADILSQSETDIPELSSLLQSKVKLITEIQEFVSQFEDANSFFKMAIKMIANADIQTETRKHIESFHVRIREIQTALLPEHNTLIDIVDIYETMKDMVDCVIKQMTDHMVDIEYLKEIVNALIANCSKQSTEIMCNLLELQKKLSCDVELKQEDLAGAIRCLHNSLLSLQR
jgi:hypothetical protein